MGRHRSPPDWHSLPERELEQHYVGDDGTAAGAALVELRRRHGEELRNDARRMCGNKPELIEEALQQLDAKLWEKRKLYDPKKGRWLPWAKKVLQRLILDMLAPRANVKILSTSSKVDADASSGDWTDELPGHEPAPDRRQTLKELEKAMADCLQQLRPEEQEALILQVLEGLSLEEIAEPAGVPWQTVGSRVYRAKLKMRECLKCKGYEGGDV